MSKRELIARNREAILALAKKHGAAELRLFGSIARGEQSATSDIDFLVKMERGRSLLDRASLAVALQDLLSCPVDVVNERGVKPRFLRAVEADLVSV